MLPRFCNVLPGTLQGPMGLAVQVACRLDTECHPEAAGCRCLSSEFRDVYIAPDPPDDESKKARALLFRLLDARLYPASTLDTKMTERGFSEAARQFALESVQSLGLQSDREYALGFARTKWRNAQWAPTRIRMALRQKRIPGDDITAALAWLAEVCTLLGAVLSFDALVRILEDLPLA